ncbi:Glu/Leu/Phe/Val dehydrogenase [Methylomarinum sp. Ch1-1]|uniref:Glutamate dehydrogenase n=1 Tax=Methylomarinum roseum TaxID=3067653 RepID=A0AAU7NTQ5_9GAMM|nr:Glu/Leu/Phe/Val dehydrogenase [Methylomarinum sp. Ch1-1]MDP4519974.1 Glu/Leu/Phe/Val dehydrogenase [Methylomarinum sp. Ch1-1]
MDNLFGFADDLGPAKIIHVYEPSVGLRGILVIDNVASGPSIGGLRIAPDVSVNECFRLARAMTLKNAAADLPHGGGKMVIYGDPKMPMQQKQLIIRAAADSLRNEESYIFGPDMGSNEECMAWVRDEIGRSVGLPTEMGGIPLDEIGATGWGVMHATELAMSYLGLDLNGARVVIQGFGSVGKHSARFLQEKGASIIAVNDSRGTVHNPQGLDLEALFELKRQGQSVADFEGGKSLERDAIIDIDCDIWIPAARPDVINESNVQRLNAKLVVQGANIPVTEGAEKYLYEHDILYVPDFIANAGGVICAAMEYRGSTKETAMAAIAEKVSNNTRRVLDISFNERVPPRVAAMKMSRARIKKAMSMRRWSLFSSAPHFL